MSSTKELLKASIAREARAYRLVRGLGRFERSRKNYPNVLLGRRETSTKIDWTMELSTLSDRSDSNVEPFRVLFLASSLLQQYPLDSMQRKSR